MRSYDPGGDVDLHGFAGSLAAYAATTATFAALTRLSGRTPPAAYSLRDLVVGGVAVHKFSRLLARGAVTSPLRAPFTRFEGPDGSSEHLESALGDLGVRHTVGALVTCPFCMDVWVGTAYVGGLQVAPRGARAWAAVFAVTAVSDFLQHAYARLRA